MGYNAAQELDNRLNALIQMNKGDSLETLIKN